MSPDRWPELVPSGISTLVIDAVGRLGPLPILSTSVRRVMELTEDIESSTTELVQAVEADEALAVNVLRLANSARHARPFQATTLRQAVTLLGRRAVRRLALEAAVYRYLETVPGNGRGSRGAMHLHAVSVAACATAAAQRAGVTVDAPHLGGLFHDFGKLVMPLVFGEAATDEVALRHPAGVQRAAEERRRFGIDHALVGALTARYWDLPTDVTAAIAWHHGGLSGRDVPSAEAACVQLANATLDVVAGVAIDPALVRAALSVLELPPDALDEIAHDGLHRESRPGPETLAARVMEIERQAQLDDLTGVANRRHWHETARRALAERGAGSLLICDVDRFKEVNDSFGHRSGDLVLTEVARVLARHGTAGRLGGDEFAVWLDADEDEATRVAARIIDEIDAAFAKRSREAPDVTVSIGVAAAGTADDLALLLEHADRALYAAKQAGRHRVGRAGRAESGD